MQCIQCSTSCSMMGISDWSVCLGEGRVQLTEWVSPYPLHKGFYVSTIFLFCISSKWFFESKVSFTLINVFFHLRKVFPLPVCVLCGCLLLRSTQWLNQYKLPSRQWDTTRKCSIIKLNYRQALKETNKYFVTIKLHFFIAMMIENVYKACMVQSVVAEEEGCKTCSDRQQTSAACGKPSWELRARAVLLVCQESHPDPAVRHSPPQISSSQGGSRLSHWARNATPLFVKWWG